MTRPTDPHLILASASPRRRDLLTRLGLSFEVVPAEIDETFTLGVPPDQMVIRLAEAKAQTIAASHVDALVIGADTTVVIDDEVLNKPVDAHHATRMLRQRRGRPHHVFTGLAVIDTRSGVVERGVVSSRVHMREYSDVEIAAYVATGEPLDKAGAYAIQGDTGVFVDRIDGCYFNVVGLPLCELTWLLSQRGFDLEPSGAVCARPGGSQCPRLS